MSMLVQPPGQTVHQLTPAHSYANVEDDVFMSGGEAPRPTPSRWMIGGNAVNNLPDVTFGTPSKGIVNSLAFLPDWVLSLLFSAPRFRKTKTSVGDEGGANFGTRKDKNWSKSLVSLFKLRMSPRREYRLTRISLAIGWILLLCHSWKVIPAAYNLYQSLHLGQGTTAEDLGRPTSPEWFVWVERIGKLLLTLNASLNLIIYAALWKSRHWHFVVANKK